MAMTSASLKTRIITKLEAAGFDTENEHSKIDAMAQAIAEAVIDEIHTSGITNVTVTTVCPAGAGSGTGSGTIS